MSFLDRRALAVLLALVGAFALVACSGASNDDTLFGKPSCQATACGTAGQSVNVCVTNDSVGCTAMSYSVGSQTFACESCTDCAAAQRQAAQACGIIISGASSSSGGTSSGGTSSGGTSSGGPLGDGGGGSGDGGGAQEICTRPAACGTTGYTYALCTTSASGFCTGAAYVTTNGQTFACANCSDCSAAGAQVAQYCAQQTGTQTSCTESIACGSTGVSYKECTTTLDGVCQSESYQTTDGRTFSCDACGNCGTAASSLSSYCQTLGTPTTTCGSATACGNEGATYQECTTSLNGTCQSVAYTTSTGQNFQCASCSSCSAAASSLSSYCATLDSPVTTCSGTTACGTNGATYESCETTQNGTCQSIYYYTSTGEEYECASCSDCSAAYSSLSSYCSSQTTTTSCSSLGSCGTNGATYEECETVTDGVCSSVYYYATTGVEYFCNSCSDCSTAYSDITSYCSTQTTSTSCSGTTTCGTGGATYETCETTSGGTCSSIYYYASTGVEYVCNSCSDCTTAYDDMASYCSTQGTTSSECGTATACGSDGATYNWCEDLSSGTCTYIYYYTSTGEEYACASCSDCSAAYSEVSSYCATQ